MKNLNNYFLQSKKISSIDDYITEKLRIDKDIKLKSLSNKNHVLQRILSLCSFDIDENYDYYSNFGDDEFCSAHYGKYTKELVKGIADWIDTRNINSIDDINFYADKDVLKRIGDDKFIQDSCINDPALLEHTANDMIVNLIYDKKITDNTKFPKIFMNGHYLLYFEYINRTNVFKLFFVKKR